MKSGILNIVKEAENQAKYLNYSAGESGYFSAASSYSMCVTFMTLNIFVH